MNKGLKNFVLFLLVYWATTFGFYGYFSQVSVHYEVLYWLGLFVASLFFVKSAKENGTSKWLIGYTVLVLLISVLLPHLIFRSVPENAVVYMTVSYEDFFARHHVIYLALAFALRKK